MRLPVKVGLALGGPSEPEEDRRWVSAEPSGRRTRRLTRRNVHATHFSINVFEKSLLAGTSNFLHQLKVMRGSGGEQIG